MISTQFLIAYGESLLIGPAFYLVYRLVFTRSNPFSMVGLIVRYAGFMGSMIGLPFALLWSPQMQWSISASSLIWDLLYARATSLFYSAHIASYMVIPAIYFLTYWVTRNEYFSFAYMLSLVSLHECVWTLFTVVSNYSLGWSYPWLPGFVNYLIMYLFAAIVLVKFYRIKPMILNLALVAFITFNMIWVNLNGFAFSVSIQSAYAYPIVYLRTAYFYDPVVNLLENLSWLLIVPLSAVLLWAGDFHVERLYGRVGEWKLHGWWR